MPSPISPAARCLNALLRYELAAVRCYSYAANVLRTDSDALTTVRRSHEFAAATLHRQLRLLDQPAADGPGLWDVLPALLQASATLSARWAVLTVLRGAEQHGIETYQSACRIPALPSPVCVVIESTLLPLLHGNLRTLEQLSARPEGGTALPSGAARLA